MSLSTSDYVGITVGGLAFGLGGWALIRISQGQPLIPAFLNGGSYATSPPPGYYTLAGKYGTIYVKLAPYTKLPSNRPQCGTAFVGLGPAIKGSPNAFGPGVAANYGVAIYTEGTLTGYNSQRAATTYGDFSGGYACS